MAIIIAEIGQNHCGDIGLARKLILLAKNNRATYCKFQLYDHNMLYGDTDIPNVELSKEQAFELFNFGKDNGIEVFFSVFDVERVKWCEEMGVKRYKVACDKHTNTNLMGALRDTGKMIYISSSCYYVPWDFSKAMVLYCVPRYPTPPDILELDYGLNWEAGWAQGFSDHTIGLDCAKIAIARGAQIIEKHFAIDHKTGIDARWSMAPRELRELRRWADVCKEVL